MKEGERFVESNTYLDVSKRAEFRPFLRKTSSPLSSLFHSVIIGVASSHILQFSSLTDARKANNSERVD